MRDATAIYGQLFAAFTQSAWPRALQLANELLPVTPSDANVHFIAGIANLELQRMPQSVEHLHRAVTLDPERADFATQYAKALALVRRMRDAEMAADRALALSPDHPSLLDTLGIVYTQVNALERAVAVFRRAVEMNPSFAAYRFNLAYALISVGDSDGAERELQLSIKLDPTHWKAHLSLAQLGQQTLTSNHIDRLNALISQYGSNAYAQIYLNVALAKEFEDIGDYASAFDRFVRGNAAVRRVRPYSAQRDQIMFENVTRAFHDVVTSPSSGCSSSEPIFIIGMPRTGTTLLDRIISSHPEVYSAGELQNFPVVLQRTYGSQLPFLLDPEIAAKTRTIDWRELGEAYISSTRPATADRPRFIDKMPHNFLYAGFIAQALPNAKLICVRRDPMDTCIGNFRHLFEQDSGFYDYSSNLLDTGNYYVLFDRLLAHWQRVLPGRIFEIEYESLVTAQEVNTRRLLEFCGLPWNEACLHSEKNTAPVNTPNAWQVRAPIYKTALQRWKNYAPQLGELQSLLTASGIHVSP